MSSRRINNVSNTNAASSSCSDNNNTTITVIDPTSRYGKLCVPISKTFDTKGRSEWVKCGGKLAKDLSICCLFQKGKCHVGDQCFQVHVERSFVTELRKKYANVTTCCHGCGDVHSDNDTHRRMLRVCFPEETVAISFGRGHPVVEVDVQRLAGTTGLTEIAESIRTSRRRVDVPVYPFSRVCRLHLKNACKYGKDCKNLHICHTVAEELDRTRLSKPEVRNELMTVERAPQPFDGRESRHQQHHAPRALASNAAHFDSDDRSDSLCPTPETRSRASTPTGRRASLSSCEDSPQGSSISISSSLGSGVQSIERMTIEPVDFVNGIAVSPAKRSSASTTPLPEHHRFPTFAASSSSTTSNAFTVLPQAKVPAPAAANTIDFAALARFQSLWGQPEEREESTVASEQSLQIIFGGFPGLSLFS